MKLLTPPLHLLPPRRVRRLVAASIAWFATVCVSMAAAVAVVTDTAPLLLAGG